MLKNNSKKVLIAMGSNASDDLQESYDLILDGLKKLSSGVISNIMVSKFYKTPAFPIGAGPDFINCALSANTNYLPEDLLNQLHLIEHDLGRTRLKRWVQRTLDIDLLDFESYIIPNKKYVNEWLNMPLDSQKIRSPEQLILPHPRIQDRSFVLIPLNDIEPNWVHPILNKSTHEMLGELSTDETIGISCFT